MSFLLKSGAVVILAGAATVLGGHVLAGSGGYSPVASNQIMAPFAGLVSLVGNAATSTSGAAASPLDRTFNAKRVHLDKVVGQVELVLSQPGPARVQAWGKAETMKELQVKIVGDELVLRIPMNATPEKSTSGKTLVVASTYGNKEVGAKFNAMMEMGASRPWPEALEAFTPFVAPPLENFVDYSAEARVRAVEIQIKKGNKDKAFRLVKDTVSRMYKLSSHPVGGPHILRAKDLYKTLRDELKKPAEPDEGLWGIK
jgi:hypothetical protein